MKASQKFLKMYVPDLTTDGKDFSEKITMSGSKIETYEKLDKNLDKIIVGKLLKIEKHENADKLVVCQVDIGKETIQIVTGATNVYEGMLCPVVIDGGNVAASAHDNEEHPNGIKIKKGKLRGVESNGMLCSIDELGRNKDLYDGIDGIFDLSKYKCNPGDDAIKLMNLDDCLYDFEITSNRTDCYSVKGIAKEVAATFDLNYNEPNTSFKTSFSSPNYIDLKVEDSDLCPIFCTRLIKDVKIEESPLWLKDCLRSVGIRPINNIVDITNFVMMEFGQPMHAYDYETIKDKKIIVKRAAENEKFITLDGEERVLNNTVLTINDGKSAIGLGGIMGGENSMITDNVKTVLFEAANFNSVNIRSSSKKLGLRTESSNLFEKGLDPNNAEKAIDRACSLVELLNCGIISEERIMFKADDKIPKVKTIEVSYKKVNSLLGTDISIDYMKKVLDRIDLTTEIKGDNLVITIPTIRKDIENYADISEEIIRFYGYDKAPISTTNCSITPRLKNNEELLEEKVYEVALFNGFSEAMNYSFESKKVYDKLRFKDNDIERKFITIKNPLGEDFSVMRTQLINGLLYSLSNNFKQKNKNVRLFEIANVYIPSTTDSENMTELPDERKTLTLAAYGDDIDFYYMKSVIEQIFEAISLDFNSLKYLQPNLEEVKSFLHPYRSANILINEECVGFLGEVHKKVADNYGITDKCYLINIDLKSLLQYSNFEYKYKEISKYPPVERDLSMLVPKDLTVDKIVDIFKNSGGKLLKDIELFDIYEGDQVKSGFKSIAYRLRFVDKTKTLESTDVDNIITKIIKKLNEFNIELRS